jgi:hypothetical protein
MPRDEVRKRESEPPIKLALSIAEFCQAISISTDMFHKLARQNRAPRTMKVGKRTLLSLDSARAWCKERERDLAPDAA